MSGEACDVLVIGGGPAGSVAAWTVKRLSPGLRVVLVDRATFPRGKVCGGCLNAGAVRLLGGAGLGEVVAALPGERLRAVRIVTGGRGVTLGLPGGLAVSRLAMDAALLDAAVAAGVEVRQGVVARVLEEGRVGVRVSLRGVADHAGADVMKAGVVLCCDGLRGGALEGVAGFEAEESAASKIGLGALIRWPGGDWAEGVERGVIYMMPGSGGYVGVVAVEGGWLDVAAAVRPEHVREAGGAGRAVAGLLRASGSAEPWVRAVAEAAVDQRWMGTPRMTRRRAVAVGERGRVLVVGDAAGYVEPFTGEGMGWAIRGGLAVAAIAVEAAEGRGGKEGVASRWRAMHGREVRGRQRACRVVAAMLGTPRRIAAAATLLRTLQRLPGGAGLMRRVVRRIAEPA